MATNGVRLKPKSETFMQQHHIHIPPAVTPSVGGVGGDAGVEHRASAGLLRRVVYCVGSGKRSRRYMRREATVAELLDMLSVHVERQTKDGSIVHFGELSESDWVDERGRHRRTRRKTKESVAAIEFIVFDFDYNTPFEDVHDALAESGLAGAAFTTHSHSEECSKVRLVLPLSRRWVPDANKSLAYSEAHWAAIYRAIGETLGFSPCDTNTNLPSVAGTLPYDPTGNQIYRAFYPPAHRPGAPHRVEVLSGDLVDIPPVDVPPPPSRSRIAIAAHKAGVVVHDVALRSAFGRLLADDGDRFDMASFVEALGWPIEWRGDDKGVIRCPNADAHSNPDDEGDEGCVAFSPGARDRAAIVCLHAHCREVRTSDFLAMICEQIEINGDPVEIAKTFVAE
jgi:hypothetical protein